MNNKLRELQELSKDIRLLYVEDEDALREIMITYLSKFFTSIDSAKDGEEGLELYNKNQYDIIITDILMPNMNGIEMATAIKNINENQNIVIISAYSDTKDFIESIKLGIDGYVLKPIDFEQLNSMLFKIVEKIHKYKENIEYQKNLEQLVYKKTQDIQQLEDAKVQNYKETIYALVLMIEKRDTYTGGHSLRVAQYSRLIAQELKLESKTCENIYQAGILHDIGKIAIPDNVLLKPSRLGDLEYTIIKEHVQIGVDMLNKIPLFKEITDYIKFHHERYDGTGYPFGLKGEQILLESQILAVSDAFDAMTTNRIYKARKTPQEALEEINSLKDIHFRKDVVESALIALKNVEVNLNITQLPVTNIEKERFSYFYKDQITQSYNSSYLDLLLIRNSYEVKYKYIYIISIHNLNSLNEKHGWKEGDKYLKKVFLLLENTYPDLYIFRVFSDDFAILSEDIIDIDRELLAKSICIENISLNIKKIDINEKKIFAFHDLELLK
mgnify:CR=1 FL=1